MRRGVCRASMRSWRGRLGCSRQCRGLMKEWVRLEGDRRGGLYDHGISLGRHERDGVKDRQMCHRPAPVATGMRHSSCILSVSSMFTKSITLMEVFNDCIPFYPCFQNKTLARRMTMISVHAYRFIYNTTVSSFPKYTLPIAQPASPSQACQVPSASAQNVLCAMSCQ